jgi:hypothetical protein
VLFAHPETRMNDIAFEELLSPTAVDRYDLSPADAASAAEALARIVDALDREQGLTALGRTRIARYVDIQLRRLVLLTADRARFPEIAAVEVAPPIFITGAPRSGTTFIHSLLSQDPQHRSPLTWEVEFPSPPPEAARLLDDPRIEAWTRLHSSPDAAPTKDLRNPDVQKKHLIGARLPEECGAMLGAVLRSPTSIWSLARATAFNDWVYRTQMAAAYRQHRRWLQHLQWRAPRRHWLLKYPMHAHALPELTAEYPDALIVQTHRAPEETVSSLASLIGTLRQGALESQDPAELGHEMLEVQTRGLEQAMDYRRTLSARPVVDVGYRELIEDPLGVVARIYDRLGLTLSGDAQARMQAFVDANPQGKAGVHAHNLGAYGLTVEAVRGRLATYLESYRDLL